MLLDPSNPVLALCAAGMAVGGDPAAGGVTRWRERIEAGHHTLAPEGTW